MVAAGPTLVASIVATVSVPAGVSFPLWQVAFLLVGLPILYLLDSTLTPWALGLWRDGDTDYYVPFWASVGVLHWAAAAGAVTVLLDGGHSLPTVGVERPDEWWATAGVTLVGLVAVAAYVRDVVDAEPLTAGALGDERGLIPATTRERALMFGVAGVTAGICEEFLFRGVGIAALLGLGWPLWGAVAGTSVSFVFIHGPAAFDPRAFVSYAGFGAAFAAVYLLSGSLLPGMVLHGAANLLLLRHATVSATR